MPDAQPQYPQPLLRRARDCRVSRISPRDTNKFVLMVDPLKDGTPFISVVEIFEVGGKTPPHAHQQAHEMFYVLSGQGRAHCNGMSHDLEQGTRWSCRRAWSTSSRISGRTSSIA